jgi:hypothetical protein
MFKKILANRDGVNISAAPGEEKFCPHPLFVKKRSTYSKLRQNQ